VTPLSHVYPARPREDAKGSEPRSTCGSVGPRRTTFSAGRGGRADLHRPRRRARPPQHRGHVEALAHIDDVVDPIRPTRHRKPAGLVEQGQAEVPSESGRSSSSALEPPSVTATTPGISASRSTSHNMTHHFSHAPMQTVLAKASRPGRASCQAAKGVPCLGVNATAQRRMGVRCAEGEGAGVRRR
jgi:hypothetical protein